MVRSLWFGQRRQVVLLVPVPTAVPIPVPNPAIQLPATAAPGLSTNIKPKLTSRPREPSPLLQITVIELLNMELGSGSGPGDTR